MQKVHFTKLKRLQVKNGDVFHGLKASEKDFSTFGEAYFTSIEYQKIKGWKQHQQMEMNLIVPCGDVRFHVYSKDQKTYQSFHLNEQNYGRLTVPPGYWLAFEGKGNGLNLVLNISSIEHCPDEVVSLPLNSMTL